MTLLKAFDTFVWERDAFHCSLFTRQANFFYKTSISPKSFVKQFLCTIFIILKEIFSFDKRTKHIPYVFHVWVIVQGLVALGLMSVMLNSIKAMVTFCSGFILWLKYIRFNRNTSDWDFHARTHYSQQVQVVHMASPHWPTKSWIVWKKFLWELCNWQLKMLLSCYLTFSFITDYDAYLNAYIFAINIKRHASLEWKPKAPVVSHLWFAVICWCWCVSEELTLSGCF